MTDTTQTGTIQTGTADPAAEDQAFPIPAKFRDPTTGTLRADALLKSYLDLENRFHALNATPGTGGEVDLDGDGIPDSPDQYRIQVRHKLLGNDPQVNERLHGAGFSHRQAQVVYDLATERVLPVLAHLATQYAAERHLGRLTEHFGGDEKWQEMARQLKAWGERNLPPDVMGALASSHEGVLALHRMMASGEPGLMRDGEGGGQALSEDALKKMMEDPRYWRDRDPAYVNRVGEGYKRLFPGIG